MPRRSIRKCAFEKLVWPHFSEIAILRADCSCGAPCRFAKVITNVLLPRGECEAMNRDVLMIARSKSRSRSNLAAFLSIGLLGIAFAVGVGIGRAGQANRPNSTLQDGLRQIVRIRRQQVERYRRLKRSSGVQYSLSDPTAELLGAEARLAAVEGRDREAKDKLGQAVAVRRRHYETLTRSRIPAYATENARVRLHEAEYELNSATGDIAKAQRNLSQIVSLKRSRLERVQQMHRSQQRPDTALDDAELSYHESRIRLAEFQLVAAERLARRPGDTAPRYGAPVRATPQEANGKPAVPTPNGEGAGGQPRAERPRIIQPPQDGGAPSPPAVGSSDASDGPQKEERPQEKKP